jgi:RecA/RadA recombinase
VNLKDAANKQFGGGIVTASDKDDQYKDICWVDTGNIALNKAINYRGLGLPSGTMVESYGASASGKTVVGMHCLRSTQEQDGIGVLIDVEGAFDINLAKDMGIDCSKLIIVNPTFPKGEDDYCPLSVDDVGLRTEWFLKEVRKQYGPDKLLTIVWDSLGATNFQEDLEKDVPQQTRGISEKGLGRWIRRVRARVDATNSLWFVINQVYANVTTTPTAEPLKAKGGKAVAFNSKIRIEWIAKKGKAGKIFDGKATTGARLHFKIDKNRIGPPWGEGFVDWHFDADGKPSLDKYSGLVNYFVGKGLVENGTGCVKIGGQSYKRKTDGDDEKHPMYVMQAEVMEKMLTEHPELLEK